jgi:hypothetical protein
MGLLTVEERRREGPKNLPNVVRIVSREWLQWLARGPKSDRPTGQRLIGVRIMTPTVREDKKSSRKCGDDRHANLSATVG